MLLLQTSKVLKFIWTLKHRFLLYVRDIGVFKNRASGRNRSEEFKGTS